MFKKTKIICTQGPATDAPGVIEGLITPPALISLTATTRGIKKELTLLKPPPKLMGKLFR